MSARGGGSDALLTDIADALGVPVEAFEDPACLNRVRRARIGLYAGLLAADPQFLRLAQAFLTLQDASGRRALADAAVAIAGAFASSDRANSARFPQTPFAPESP